MRRIGGNEGPREHRQTAVAGAAAKAPAAGAAKRADTAPALPDARPLPSSASDVRARNVASRGDVAGVGAGVLDLVSALKDTTPALMPMLTTPRRDLQGEITGHLRRVIGKKNQVEATFYPDDRRIKPLILHPQDAQGIAEGGRISIQASEGGLQLVTPDTEKVYSIVGRVERDGTGLAVVARDPKAPLQRVPLKDGDDSLLGKTVLAHIEEPLSQGRTAELSQVFGDKDAWRIKFSEIAVQRGVEATFSKRYLAELAKLKAAFNPDKVDGYVDLTDKPFITIDNPYSMDLDQAMYIEDSKTTPGASDVYYAIADISYFFKLSGGDAGAINERARRLQTTTYMPGVDMPVLHRALSEDIISLGPDVKRPSIVIKYTVGEDGKVIGKPEFLDAVIKSQRKTNYGAAQDFIDGKVKIEDPVLVNAFNRLKKVGGALLEQAKSRGMITAPEGERWANIDANGELVLERRGMRWIEEANAQISITANALVGEFLVEHNAPAYHRVHKAADEARIALARETVRTLGVDWPDNVSPAAMLAKLDKAMPKYRAVRNVVLRSQPRAIVSADPTSHEGLKLAHYVQVTAPMRRERDGRNHEFVRQVRDGKTPDTSRGAEVLEWAAIAQERDSRVENEIRGIISAKALESFSGKVLKGEITFLSPRGFEVYFADADIARFVELPGRNRLEANGTVLRSDGGNPITITLGETMDLRVGAVNAIEGRAEIVPLTESKPIEKKGKPQGAAMTQTIGQIRGDGFTSSLVGKRVTTEGVVSGVNAVGFYVESANPDEGGLLVRTRGARVAVGDKVRFTATVRENHDANNEFARSLVELVEATPPERIGAATLSPPVDLEKLGAPPADAAGATEYWRKLLGRRIAVAKGKAISPSNRFGDLVVLPEAWKLPAERFSRFGGVLHREGVENFSKVSLKFREQAGKPAPLSVGATLSGMTGIVGYRSGDFQIELTEAPQIVSNPPHTSEVTRLVGDADHYTIASVNMLNINPMEQERAKRLAKRIVDNLKSPDVISVQEIQDNDGPKQSDVVKADQTFEMMARLIKEAGGPEYAYIDVPPQNGKDGGEPGGNIRCGFFYRKDRVSHDPASVKRLGEGEAAFMDSRKSLVARFKFGNDVFEIINDHWASRRGSTPWNSAHVPPIIGGEDKRNGQAITVRSRMEKVQKAEPNVDVFKVGDSNTTEQSSTIKELTKNGLANLTMELIPREDRFDYNYRGTQQVLCPIVSTAAVFKEGRVEMQYIHANSVSPLDDSDHDHSIMRIKKRG